MTRLTTDVGKPALQGATPENPLVQNLFQPVSWGRGNADPSKPADPIIRQGSLITFNYLFRKHDPYPMVIVSSIIQGNRIKGINLNYLTFFDIRRLIQAWGDKPAFSYQAIKADKAIVDLAFREYKWQGVRMVKKFNSQFLLNVITMSRTFDIHQIQAMRNAIKQQMRQVNLKAKEIAEGKGLYTPEAQSTGQRQNAFPNVPIIGSHQPIGPTGGGEINQ